MSCNSCSHIHEVEQAVFDAVTHGLTKHKNLLVDPLAHCMGYGELMQTFGWGRTTLSQALSEVSQYDFDMGRPFITSVFISAGSNRPSNGFWGCVQAATETWVRPQDHEEFWQRQVWQTVGWVKAQMHDYSDAVTPLVDLRSKVR